MVSGMTRYFEPDQGTLYSRPASPQWSLLIN
ncbi:hypothetical protein XFF6992_370215 [Xanthomonas citri pv. fuscans]|nr:hypothetical protein XFF6992_370215 [Xanthomonas citri pv. fuscans]SOO33951.1 hypothetical protein XFF6994_3300010 [Xanthomonas citri pv. fuscans]SOO35928.1 hypothetical protein XFF6994_640003 [Xanthomonas citri pv. fuscans]